MNSYHCDVFIGKEVGRGGGGPVSSGEIPARLTGTGDIEQGRPAEQHPVSERGAGFQEENP